VIHYEMQLTISTSMSSSMMRLQKEELRGKSKSFFSTQGPQGYAERNELHIVIAA